MLRSLFLISLIGLLINIDVSARELTLNDALDLALQQNKNIQIAKADRSFADALVKEAWSSALPRIDAGVSYNHNLKDNFFYITTADSAGRTSTTALE